MGSQGPRKPKQLSFVNAFPVGERRTFARPDVAKALEEGNWWRRDDVATLVEAMTPSQLRRCLLDLVDVAVGQEEGVKVLRILRQRLAAEEPRLDALRTKCAQFLKSRGVASGVLVSSSVSCSCLYAIVQSLFARLYPCMVDAR